MDFGTTKEIYTKLDKFMIVRPYIGPPLVGENSKYYYSYIIINLITLDFYVGIKSYHFSYADWYFGSGREISLAISEYGVENFYNFPFKYYSTWEDAKSDERILITREMILSPECYNVNTGGLGFACGEFHPSHNRILNGTHNFLGNSHPMKLASNNGTHHYTRRSDGSSFQQDLVQEGVHNFITNHPNKGKPWTTTCVSNLDLWKQADVFYDIWIQYDKPGYSKFAGILNSLGYKLTRNNIQRMVCGASGFQKGWNPKQDLEFKKFKHSKE